MRRMISCSKCGRYPLKLGERCRACGGEGINLDNVNNGHKKSTASGTMRRTQADKVLSYIDEHGSIDRERAWSDLGIDKDKLSVIICKIRYRGVKIALTHKRVCGVTLKVYSIRKDV